MLHCSVGVLLLGACLLARGTEVGVVGLFPNKAVVTVNGGPPLTLGVGDRTAEGVSLRSVDASGAVLEFDGKRHRIGIGEQVFARSPATPVGVATLRLMGDAQGHFFTNGTLNGASLRFLVDTGATLVSLGASDARRAGIDYSKGQPQMTMTANGAVRVWKVKLNTLRVGDMTVHEVDAAVHEHDLPVALLGMSFLNRMEMQREGDSMTLKQRY